MPSRFTKPATFVKRNTSRCPFCELSVREIAEEPSQSSWQCEKDTPGSARLLSPQVGNCLPPGVAPSGRGDRLACSPPPFPTLGVPVSRLLGETLNRRQGVADREGVSATIDDRLLERWTTSRRHQDEARRFLARQRFSDPRGERLALDEIVGTIADLEQTLRDRTARRLPPPAPPGPPSA